jgi:hypothetical protein
MKEKKKATGPGVHSLPEERWPAAERAAWDEARRPSIRLKRGGSASHLRAVVQRDLGKRNGLFLESVARSGRLDMNAPAGAHVTPEGVDAWVAELKGRVSSVTVYGSIQKLRRFTQLIAPKRDLGWLIEIEHQLLLGNAPTAEMGSGCHYGHPGRRRADAHGRSRDHQTAQTHPR